MLHAGTCLLTHVHAYTHTQSKFRAVFVNGVRLQHALVLSLKHAGLTTAKEVQPMPTGLSVVSTAFTSSPAFLGPCFGIAPDLFRQKEGNAGCKCTGTAVRKQDKSRQGQKKCRIQYNI